VAGSAVQIHSHRLLTAFGNIFLGANLSEYHSAAGNRDSAVT